LGITTDTIPEVTTSSAPQIISAVSGNGEVTITFNISSDGGSPITNYEYSIDNGATFTPFSPAQTTSPVTITGLTNGTTYQIVLRTLNANGTGTASTAVSVTPSTTPSQPTGLAGTSGNQQATISFTAGFNGGSPITNYQYSINNGATFTAFSPAQTTSTVTITGLTNGTSYQILLKAVNVKGAGTASAAVSVTPSTTPSQPTGLTGTAGNQQATISFTAGSTGGSPITNYEYSTNNGVTFTAFSPVQTTSPVTITGLTNGTTYAIVLRALNANGSGIPSAAVSVTPSTTPSQPTGVVGTAGNQQATISFTAARFLQILYFIYRNFNILIAVSIKFSLDLTKY
jgi:titin